MTEKHTQARKKKPTDYTKSLSPLIMKHSLNFHGNHAFKNTYLRNCSND